MATRESPVPPAAGWSAPRTASASRAGPSSPRPNEASLTGAQAAVRVLLTSIRRGDDPDEASLAAVRQAHEAMAILGSPSPAASATYVSAIVTPEAVPVR